MSEVNDPAHCPDCNTVGKRIYEPAYINKVSSGVFMPQYVPSLGKAFNSRYEMKEYVKSKGMVEIGNDYGSGENMQKEFDQGRERASDERWAKYDEHEKLAGIVKDGGNI